MLRIPLHCKYQHQNWVVCRGDVGDIAEYRQFKRLDINIISELPYWVLCRREVGDIVWISAVHTPRYNYRHQAEGADGTGRDAPSLWCGGSLLKKGWLSASRSVMRCDGSYSSMRTISSNSCRCSSLLLCRYLCNTTHKHIYSLLAVPRVFACAN